MYVRVPYYNPKDILVTPQTAVAGSRLGTIDILIDEAKIVDDIQNLETHF